jgi:glutathionyl-hydroquinone reductase
MVNNSEDDIRRMFNDAFANISGADTVELFPPAMAGEQDSLSAEIYDDAP